VNDIENKNIDQQIFISWATLYG